MERLFILIILSWLCMGASAIGQVPDTLIPRPAPAPEFDESELVTDEAAVVSEAAAANPFQGYSTYKVPGGTPTKLISLGYDFQPGFGAPVSLGGGPNAVTAEAARVNANHGPRLGFNWPFISKSSMILNAGFNYLESYYNVEPQNQHLPPVNLLNRLGHTGLRSFSLAFTLFKPLNHKNFLLVLGGADVNGDYNSLAALGDNFAYAKPWGFAVYGWNPNPRTAWGIGFSTSYRAGIRTYVPVVMYNKTFSPKWGLELFAPVRGWVRYNFSTRNMLTLGWDLEGNTYRIRNTAETSPLAHMELRKSELRFRLGWERQLKHFWWVTAQVGYRHNFSFVLVESDHVGRNNYLQEYDLGGIVFVNLGFHLVTN